MHPIQFKNLNVKFSKYFQLKDINWQLSQEQHWAILGPNGSGKSALAAVLLQQGEILSGELNGLPDNIASVSFEAQQELIERERLEDDSDITDQITEGRLVHELLEETARDSQDIQPLTEQLGIQALLHRGFRKLSTGETRKVLLARALLSQPDLLILDEPFDGLDHQAAVNLKSILQKIQSTQAMLLILNRLDEVPAFISHIALMNQGALAQTLDCNNREHMQQLNHLFHLQQTDLKIPPADPGYIAPALDNSKPLVRLNKVKVSYSGEVIFSDLNWEIQPGQHWQLSGPNGSGKTTLLNLITGDHPQSYANDIFVFGYQRGSGESIWQIKQHIGYVSSALQWDYRVSISALNVIISGFFDSIGIYQNISDSQKHIARQWLDLLGMTDKQDIGFKQLSYGEQRLLLIARAMVKHPKLLILDEPCQGLDDLNRQLVMALINKLCDTESTSILYVTHHMADELSAIDNSLALSPR